MAAARFEHFIRVAAFVEIADEHEDGVGGAGDLFLAVAKGLLDIRAAAELNAEEDFDGVMEHVGKVDDVGVKSDEGGSDRAQGGQNGAEDARVDNGTGHRAALIDAQDDVAEGLALTPEANEAFGDDCAVVGLIVLEIGFDGAGPVDFIWLGAAVADGAAQAACDGLG